MSPGVLGVQMHKWLEERDWGVRAPELCREWEAEPTHWAGWSITTDTLSFPRGYLQISPIFGVRVKHGRDWELVLAHIMKVEAPPNP